MSFRWYTIQEARARGVGGWVRNLPDGRVEAVFEGSEPDVEALVKWCSRGPRHARVTKVEVDLDEPVEGIHEFDVDV